MPRIAVILGSTRPGRRGEQVARWVMDVAGRRTDGEFELVDLADHPLPHLDEPLLPSMGQYQNAHTQNWAATIARFDGFVFVTPEYNHSTSGVLKNAMTTSTPSGTTRPWASSPTAPWAEREPPSTSA
jgi:NAD(P)H-dependent FMN reductase